MQALLVRIAVDQVYGWWNAPVDPASNRFVYLPIPEEIDKSFHGGLERRYQEFIPALENFCGSFNRHLHNDLHFPGTLMDHPVHLDPDFSELTYGDVGSRRGTRMKNMTSGDLLVFYAGLKPISPCGHKLVYALIGLYVVDEVLEVGDVPRDRWHQNAHTRRLMRGPTDIVVRAKQGVSGRMERCIPIGEWRGGAYRVSHRVLNSWGGLSNKDGYIQRSAVPPLLTDPMRFYDWFLQQNMPLVQRNN